jgi:hypothetical protein
MGMAITEMTNIVRNNHETKDTIDDDTLMALLVPSPHAIPSATVGPPLVDGPAAVAIPNNNHVGDVADVNDGDVDDEQDVDDPMRQLTVDEATVLYNHILTEMRDLPGGDDGVGVDDDDPRDNIITPVMAQRAAAILSVLAARIRRGDEPEQMDEKLPPHPLPLDLLTTQATTSTFVTTSTPTTTTTSETKDISNDNEDEDDDSVAGTPVASSIKHNDEPIIRTLASLLPYYSPVMVSSSQYAIPKPLLELVFHYCVDTLSIADEYDHRQEYVAAYPWYERAVADFQRDSDHLHAIINKDNNDIKREIRGVPLNRTNSSSSSGSSSGTMTTTENNVSNARALYQLAFYLRVGLNACQVDDDRSSVLMLRSIDMGYVPALAPMSRCYYYGKVGTLILFYLLRFIHALFYASNRVFQRISPMHVNW